MAARPGGPRRGGGWSGCSPAPTAPPSLLAAGRELGEAVHAGGGWERVLELRRAELRDDTDPEEVAALAALALDRAGDAAGALAMCWRRLVPYPGGAGGGEQVGEGGRAGPGRAGEGGRAGPAGGTGSGTMRSAGGGGHEGPTRAFGKGPATDEKREAPTGVGAAGSFEKRRRARGTSGNGRATGERERARRRRLTRGAGGGRRLDSGEHLRGCRSHRRSRAGSARRQARTGGPSAR